MSVLESALLIHDNTVVLTLDYVLVLLVHYVMQTSYTLTANPHIVRALMKQQSAISFFNAFGFPPKKLSYIVFS